MRVQKQTAKHFIGTHKGASIEIERDREGRFYITVRWKDGGALYDGYAPVEVCSMAQAKREAVRGACLDRKP